MKTDQALAQSPFQVVMHSSSRCLQFFAWSEVGGVSPCVGMSVHVFV